MNTLLAQGIRNPIINSFGEGPYTSGGQKVGLLIGNLIGIFIIFGFLSAFFYLLSGGVSWITAGGDKSQLETARNKIIHALVGLLIISAVWAIFSIVGKFLGINFPNMDIPSIQDNL